MKCNAYRTLIGALDSGELDEEESGLLRRHLDVCENCRAYQDGRRATDGSTPDGDMLPGEVPYRPAPVARSAGRSWGWAAVAVIGLAALVALVLLLGPGRGAHRGGAHRGAGTVKHTVWRTP